MLVGDEYVSDVTFRQGKSLISSESTFQAKLEYKIRLGITITEIHMLPQKLQQGRLGGYEGDMLILDESHTPGNAFLIAQFGRELLTKKYFTIGMIVN